MGRLVAAPLVAQSRKGQGVKIAYKTHQFTRRSTEMIALANSIITTYQAQGYDLTLRQLYYQLVARDIIANKQSEYDKLGTLISNARYAGLIDWDAIVDRTRFMRTNSHWTDAADIVSSAAASYRLDRWSLEWGQAVVPEVWIEKDALVGVLDGVCTELDVPYFSCRGYTSSSELWAAAMRMVVRSRKGQRTIVFHFGDHDPSGIDMSRDIEERLALFCIRHGADVPELRRVALNMNQITQYNPPPNPAKQTDSRFQAYERDYGTDESWELDALEPTIIGNLIRTNIATVRDEEGWRNSGIEQAKRRAVLKIAADEWPDVVGYLEREELIDYQAITDEVEDEFAVADAAADGDQE